MPELTPAAVRATRQEVRSSNKVLILGSTVNGGIDSREAQAALAYAPPGVVVDVVTPAQWRLMSATQFMSYRAIVIGDAACTAGEAAFQAAIDTRATWGAIVDGDVVIISTNVSSNNAPQIVENGIRDVISNTLQYRTGMYISLGCAYQSAPANTHVALLEPFGEF
ncbi:MAG TPA: hypothetical protein VD972_10040, partial [Hyalangium sp.]|nr:hypothetical protein [Hyalangium sp.]